MYTIRTPLIAACGALVLLFAAPAAVHADDDDRRLIDVTGTAERRVAPDMAYLQLDVVTQHTDSASARREADAITAAALQSIRDAGVGDPDIDTTGLSIDPQYQWLKDERRQELTGYRVSRSIQVRLLDLAILGQLVTTLSDTGINRMQPPRLGLQDEERVYLELLADAALNAQTRARVIAGALGEELGPVISASIERNHSPRPVYAAKENMMMADAAAGTVAPQSYSAGYLDYSVTMSASFSLD